MNDTFTAPITGSGATLPRVLIIGQTFTSDTGGGITLSSLFKGWPKEKLAIAVESKEGIDFERSSNYFRMGYRELKMPFPFSVFQRKTKSGPINRRVQTGALEVKPGGSLKNKMKRYFDRLMHLSGLFFWMYGNERVSDELVRWIKKFDPEVIYFQPNSYKSIGFVLELHETLQLPLVTHVMDDWFSFAVRPSPLRKFWQKKLDARVRALFAASRLHLSICEYMSDAYLDRYGYQFYPFHNTVDPAYWNREKDLEPLNCPVHVLYAGRLGNGVNKTLLKVCQVIEKMAEEGEDVFLEIQTRDQDQVIAGKLKSFRHVRLTPAIHYRQLPDKFAVADILLIPCDFEGPGLTFIRYSMPTKVSEYMATGTPVLVIGPEGTALTEYAKKGWAKLCLSFENESIRAAIRELMISPGARKQIVSESHRLVLKNHDERTIIRQFRQKLLLLNRRVSQLN